MPHYRYQASTPGQVQAGVLTADNASAAAVIRATRGSTSCRSTPSNGDAAAEVGAVRSSALNYNSGPTQKDILDFTTQLAVMIRAGISPARRARGHRRPDRAPQVQEDPRRRSRTTSSPASSSPRRSAQHPKLFGPLYINMVRASEMSGSFAKMLDRIAAYIAQQIETARWCGAMIYPAIIGTMASA
jgi:type IV pilus assembly protein PilC